MNADLDPDTARPPEALRDAEGLAPSTRIVEGYPSLDGPQAITDSVSGTTTARRVNPDDGRFIRLVVGGVVIAGVVAFAISFSALYEPSPVLCRSYAGASTGCVGVVRSA